MKISKKELKQIIKEEAVKFKRKIELQNELSEIQTQLDEVVGGPGTHQASDTAGEMYTKKFDKKNAGGFDALVEDETEEGFGEGFGEGVAEEGFAEEGFGEGLGEEIDIAEIFAEMDENIAEEGFAEEGVAEGFAEEGVAEGFAEEGLSEEEEVQFSGEESLAENLEEPIDGVSPIQEAPADKTNDNMEKVKGLGESKESDKEILSEEQMRMQKLAGIKRNIL